MVNWNDVLKYVTEHALVFGIAGTFGLIGTTIGSITAHHVRKLRRKTAPKLYLNKADKLKAKARRWEEKKIAKKLLTVDSETKAILLNQFINGVQKKTGARVKFVDEAGNEVESDSVLKLG